MRTCIAITVSCSIRSSFIVIVLNVPFDFRWPCFAQFNVILGSLQIFNVAQINAGFRAAKEFYNIEKPDSSDSDKDKRLFIDQSKDDGDWKQATAH